MYVDIVTYLPDEIESFENDYGKLVTEEEDKLEQRKVREYSQFALQSSKAHLQVRFFFL